MREIVEAGAVGRLFLWLAILTPLLGIGLGALLGRRSGQVGRGIRIGFFCGLIGPLNWAMWQIYNGLTDRNGLDTVQNVLVDLAVFVLVGCAIGLWLGLIVSRSRPSQLAPTSASTTRTEGVAGSEDSLSEQA